MDSIFENNLIIKDLTTAIGDNKILEDICCTCRGGQITAILGKNGVGKTSLFRSILGTLPTEKGEVLWQGKNLLSMKSRERATYVSYCLQNTGENTEATVEELVLAGVTPYLGLFEWAGEKYYSKAEIAFKKFQLEELRYRSLADISGGERQRTHLAKCFVQDTPILLLDEPTSYLDFEAEARFMEMLATYVSEKNLVALMSVQNPNLALTHAHKILYLYEGQIRAEADRSAENFVTESEEGLKLLYGNHIELVCYDGCFVRWR